MNTPLTCHRTGIRYRWAVPGGQGEEGRGEGGPAPSAVFFLNGIGLDLDGFQDAIQALGLPWALDKYPYGQGLHVALTVPGFENAKRGKEGPLLTMAEQGRQVAAFMEGFLAEARGS